MKIDARQARILRVRLRSAKTLLEQLAVTVERLRAAGYDGDVLDALDCDLDAAIGSLDATDAELGKVAS